MRTFAAITFLLMLSTTFNYAEPLVNTENLNFEVSYFNAINKSAVNLQKYFERYPEEERDVILKNDRFINSILKSELYRLADIYAEQPNLTPSMRVAIREKLKATLLKLTSLTLKDTSHHLKLMARKHGYGKIVAIALSFVLDIAVPMAIPPITPISVYTPYFVLIDEFIFKPIEKTQRRVKTNRALGMNSSEYWRMKKEISQKLKSNSQDDLLFPIVSDQLFTIQRSSFFNTVFNRLGINKSKSNYYSINNFVKKNNILDDHIKWINKNKKISKEVKALLIIYHIFDQADGKIKGLFAAEFSSFFTSRAHLPRLNHLKSWTKMIMNAQDINDVNKAMTLIPPGIPPIVIAEVWQSLVIDELIKRIPMKAGALQRLKQDLEVLKAVATTKQHQKSWNKSYAKLFQQKLATIIPEYKKSCQLTHKDLFNLLLKNSL